MKTKTIAWDVVAWDVVAGVIVAAIGVMDPSEDDWRSFVRVMIRPGTLRVLVHTHGGMPRPACIGGMSESLLDRFPFAVLTDGAPWSNHRIRCFPTSAVDKALDYLFVPHERRGLVGDALRKQRVEMGSLRV